MHGCNHWQICAAAQVPVKLVLPQRMRHKLCAHLFQQAADQEDSVLQQRFSTSRRCRATGSRLTDVSSSNLLVLVLCMQCDQLCGLQHSYYPHTGLPAPLLPWGNVRTSAGRFVDPLQSALQNVIQIPCSSSGSCRAASQVTVRTLTSASRRPASGLRVRHPLPKVPAPNGHGSSWQQGEASIISPPLLLRV